MHQEKRARAKSFVTSALPLSPSHTESNLVKTSSKRLPYLIRILTWDCSSCYLRDGFQKLTGSIDYEVLEIICMQKPMINPMRFYISIEIFWRKLAFLFKSSQIYRWNISADLTITACWKRSLIYDAVPFWPVISGFDTVIFWKYVMYVDLLIREGRQIHLRPRNKVAGIIFQNQCHHTFICYKLTGLQSKQPHWIEVEVFHGLQQISAIIDPLRYPYNIICISGFIYRTIQFTEDAALVPLLDRLLHIHCVDPIIIRQHSTNSG